MIIHTAYFVGSFTTVKQCPPPDKAEYAFIGRSNVGKSSLINMLTGRKSLARVSNTPGKTQHINQYLINDNWYLTDLPGYGYAKVSKTSRKKWIQFIRQYLNKRTNLMFVALLIDARIPPQTIDLEFANWLGEMHLPFIVIYTKADKLKPEQLKKNIFAFEEAMMENWTKMPQTFTSSARKKTGRDEILAFIDEINEQFLTLE